MNMSKIGQLFKKINSLKFEWHARCHPTFEFGAKIMPGRSILLALTSLLCALVASLAAGDARVSDQDRPVVRVVYFVPTDRKPEPDFLVRLDRVMSEVQQFYRTGMDHNGYGKLGFELDRDSKGALRIHEVLAKGPMRDYGRDGADKVRQEVKAALAKEKIDIDRETIIIFQLLLEWRGDKAEEIGPYVGGGGPRGGTAWVYDDAKLDPRLLTSREPGGFYHGLCSLGQFNTHYIGGVAHELGHAFGLPHDCECELERPRRGSSLMGGGNHTYGQEQRGEGQGAFLSAASALPLSVHPLFTGQRVPPQAMNYRLAELTATHQDAELRLEGRLQGGPRAIGLVGHNDPSAPLGDYDAVGWTCPVDADGKFQLAVGELKPGEYSLRLAAYGESGDSQSFTFRYSVDREKRPDLTPFVETVALHEAHAAFRASDTKRLAEIAGRLKKQLPADCVPLRKLEHLLTLLLARPELRSLAEVEATASKVAVSDLKLQRAEVGWGQALRNRVVVEGEASCLLEVGGKFQASGLYAHAPARHALHLDGKWKTFTTGYGLQDGHDGSVVFVIKGDGIELFRSPTVRDHLPREQTLDVSKVSLLELLVEDAGDGGNSDWGVWLAPQLLRRDAAKR
jgi:NPCBM/NEW2 domain